MQYSNFPQQGHRVGDPPQEQPRGNQGRGQGRLERAGMGQRRVPGTGLFANIVGGASDSRDFRGFYP